MFILYDGRAKLPVEGSTDDATVLDTADSESEARHEGRTTWKNHDAIWYEYDDDGKTLTNPRQRWDLPPAQDLSRQGGKRYK